MRPEEHLLAFRPLLESMLLPGFLIIVTWTMVVYRHMTEGKLDLPIRDFLVGILVQNLPLCALKFKVMPSTSRLVLLSGCITKVLLMHVGVLALRVTIVPMLLMSGDSTVSENDSVLAFWVHFCALCSSLYILNIAFDFRWSFSGLSLHSELGTLMLVAFSITLVQLYDPLRQTWLGFFSRFTNNLEMLGYVPAWLMLFRTDPNFSPISQKTTQQQAVYFLVWMIGFYAYEDVIGPAMTLWDEPLVMGGHFVHLLMLLDFSCLFLLEAFSSKVAKVEQPMQGDFPTQNSFSGTEFQNVDSLNQGL